MKIILAYLCFTFAFWVHAETCWPHKSPCAVIIDLNKRVQKNISVNLYPLPCGGNSEPIATEITNEFGHVKFDVPGGKYLMLPEGDTDPVYHKIEGEK